MTTKRMLLATLACGALLVLGYAQTASANYTAEPLPAPGPALPGNTLTAGDCFAPAPACAVPCCRKPCVTYRHRGPKLCCGCEPGTPTVLQVKNPCTSCETEVEVCLPACCKGEPKICCASGVFGREVIEYQWCCGYSVRVAFKHTGDLLVTTWGR